MEHDRPQTNVDDQRATERRALEAQVELEVLKPRLTGESDNVSSAGILLYSDEPVLVQVRFEGPEGLMTRRGRVVRLQRMGDGRHGLAVEFDD